LNTKQTSMLQSCWEFFCSLKLAIMTLILLAVTSIVGTVLPQTASPQENLERFGATWYKLFAALDVFDMYHSWWFLTLLTLFAINLVCCSIKRLPRVWRQVRQVETAPDERFFATLANRQQWQLSQSAAHLQPRVAAFLAREFSRPVVTNDEGRIHFFVQKAPWARFGVYVTHLSILVIFIGAILGTAGGYKAYVNIPEGGSSSQVWPRGGKQPIELGFEVLCDRFAVEFYPGSQRPKEFTSELRVLENGREVLRKTIEVNDPLSYRGITFYQSSYGPMGDPQFRFRVRERAGGEEVTLQLRQGEVAQLPGGKAFRVLDATTAFQGMGPAARVEVLPGVTHVHQAGEQHPSFVVLQNFPDFDARRGGDYIFSLLEQQQRYYTGLQVAKDPGVWVVWSGCLLLVLGCLAAFFLSHRRLWLTLQADGDQTSLTLGGAAHRNQPAFELWFEGFQQRLRDELEK